MPGHNNWIKLDWSTQLPMITLDFSNFSESIALSKKSAIDLNVEQIIKNYSNLHVCLSGGIDSEFVANCLLERNIPFTPVIVDYRINGSEIWWAYKWCYQNKIVPKILQPSENFLATILPKFLDENPGFSFPGLFDKFILSCLDSEATVIAGVEEPFVRPTALTDRLSENVNRELSLDSFGGFGNSGPDKKNTVCFMHFTPEFFVNLVSGINYNKPVQLALSEYYDVESRPKMGPGETMHLSDKIRAVHIALTKKYVCYNFNIGNKDAFLAKVKNKEKILLTTTTVPPL